MNKCEIKLRKITFFFFYINYMYLCQKFTNVLIFANMLEKEITLQDLVSDKDGVIKVTLCVICAGLAITSLVFGLFILASLFN